MGLSRPRGSHRGCFDRYCCSLGRTPLLLSGQLGGTGEEVVERRRLLGNETQEVALGVQFVAFFHRPELHLGARPCADGVADDVEADRSVVELDGRRHVSVREADDADEGAAYRCAAGRAHGDL